jgi:hypothetical protein
VKGIFFYSFSTLRQAAHCVDLCRMILLDQSPSGALSHELPSKVKLRAARISSRYSLQRSNNFRKTIDVSTPFAICKMYQNLLKVCSSLYNLPEHPPRKTPTHITQSEIITIRKSSCFTFLEENRSEILMAANSNSIQAAYSTK